MKYFSHKFSKSLLLVLSSIFLGLSLDTLGQSKKNSLSTVNTSIPNKPKLVLGIIVDQMRFDYLYRYQNRYSEGGFKRLIREGINCVNAHYPYAPTVTAAGHASVYSGSVPAIHGIVGNDWTDPNTGKKVYCTEDADVQGVGVSGSSGQMSPKNLWTSTITDQLKIAQNFKSKTIAIALKDRGAILPGGHTADGAYWFDSKEGHWVSSTFYMKNLPQWVQDFNAEAQAKSLAAKPWNTLFPIETYTQSHKDQNAYEGRLPGESQSTFPHALTGGNPLETMRTSPWGNTITKNFALRALEKEGLGQGEQTDFLAVSFSSPDYIGHTFGPQSIELEDCYLRLDRDLEEMFKTLDSKLGPKSYVVFLSADHAVAEVPGFMAEKKLPGGVFDRTGFSNQVKLALQQSLGVDQLIVGEENSQLYLDQKVMERLKLDRNQIKSIVEKVFLRQAGADRLIDLKAIASHSIPASHQSMMVNGYHPSRSGDFMLLLKPQWFFGSKTGTTHGSLYAYDTHVPMLFMGWKLPAKEIQQRTHITDIAPSLSSWLRCLEPSGSIGQVIPLN